MNTYDVWTPLARDVPRLRVQSPDSFTARKDFAAMHPGMEVTDVCASRVFVPQAPWLGGPEERQPCPRCGLLYGHRYPCTQ